MNTRDDILTKDELGESGDRTIVSPPSLDVAKYRDIVGDLDIPEEELDEFLMTLLDIMNSFVENAWDVRIIPAFLPEIFDDPSEEVDSAVASDDEEDSHDQT